MTMPLNKYVALDIGSSGITAMAAEVLDNNIVRVLSVESITRQVASYGIVENTSEASYDVVKLSKLLRNSAKLPAIQHISVSVNAKGMKNKVVSISRFLNKNETVTDDMLFDMHAEVRKKVTGDAVHVFDVIPLSYNLDEEEMDDPVGKKGIHLSATYNVIYGALIVYEKLEGIFDRNELYCDHKPLSVEALSTVLLSDEDREKGCVLMNFGATTTTAGVYHDGVLQHLMVLPLGGRNITKDISELGISRINAEKLKCLKGCALSSQVHEPVLIKINTENPDAEPVKISTLFLAEIIEARLEEILSPFIKLLDDIDFPLMGGIVVAGGASRLSGLENFLKQKTGLNVRTGNHNKFLSPDQHTRYSDTAYSQLIGTVLLAHQHYIDNPPEEKVKNKRGSSKPKRGIKVAITDIFIDFFKDENSMEDEPVGNNKNKNSQKNNQPEEKNE